jgi:hypothetical protein
VSFRSVCEPCCQALGLQAERSYWNAIRRETAAEASRPHVRVVRRDPSGKPLAVGRQQGEVFETVPASCVCACEKSGHDPRQCTGAEQFKVGGRPGSGAVDDLARKLGREPIPELAVAQHEACQALVTHFVAWRLGSSDEDRIRLESSELRAMGYEEQLRWLRDLLREERPELASQPPYCDIVPKLKMLAGFRHKVAHSWPVNGDFFARSKRERAGNVTIRITPEELATYLDLAMELQSQLTFLPMSWEIRRAA